MSRCLTGCLVVVCVSAALFAFADEEAPCCGEGKAEAKRVSPEGILPPPCGCPIAPIEDLGGGVCLFLAEYFAESCSEEPEVIEMYGPCNMPLSPGCDTNCLPAKRKERKEACQAPVYFPGLDDFVEHDTQDKLLPPYDGENSRLLTDPKIPYIRFQPDPINPDVRYAKVFVHALNLGKKFGDHKLHRHLIYVAKEVETPPPCEDTPMPLVAVEALQSDDVCQGKECHLFRVRFRGHNPEVQMLLLTKK